MIQAIRSPARHDGQTQATPAGLSTGRLLITGAALSIDNLAVGFALGTFHVSLALAAAVIGVISVAMSLIGPELGKRIGARAGDRGELIGGLAASGRKAGRGPRRTHRRPGADRCRDRRGQRRHLAPSR